MEGHNLTGLCHICHAPATCGILCTQHLNTLKQNIRATPGLLKELDTTITKQARQTPPGRGGSEKWVFNPEASETAHELRAALHALNPHGPHWKDTPIETTAHQAVHNLEMTVRNPNAAERIDRFNQATKHAWQTIDRAPEHRVIGECECGHQLTTTRTTGTHTCRQCGRRWDIQMSTLSRILAVKDHETTPEQAAALITDTLGVPCRPETLRTWIKRGHLTPTRPGRTFVRIGDVLDVLESRKGRLPGRVGVDV